jgi:hypothetical protein
VKEAFDEGDRIVRARGGGWLNHDTGEFLEGVRLVYYGHHIFVVNGEGPKECAVC